MGGGKGGAVSPLGKTTVLEKFKSQCTKTIKTCLFGKLVKRSKDIQSLWDQIHRITALVDLTRKSTSVMTAC